jgi:hypothetical protein
MNNLKNMQIQTSYIVGKTVIFGIVAILVMMSAALTASANGKGGDINIPAGQDAFGVSDAGFNLQLPPDFFGPGSEPFEGIIICEGQSDAGTDTIIERKTDINLPPPPSSDTVPIELIQLDLVSCQPIVVNHNDGSQQQWDVQIDLSLIIPPTGQMIIKRIDENGGTFDAQLPVQPRFIFTQVEDGVITEPGTGITDPGTIVDDNPLELQSIIWELVVFDFSAIDVPWFVCLDTTSDFCPGPVAFSTDNGWMNLIPLQPALPDEICEFPLPNGGLVVLPTPHNPNPSSDKSQSPDQLRRAADRLEAKGLTGEANLLRGIAETIEVIQEKCAELPPIDEDDPPVLPLSRRGR